MAHLITIEVSDEQLAAIEEAAALLSITAEELAALALYAVARHTRARGRLTLPIRLEGDPIRPRGYNPGGPDFAPEEPPEDFGPPFDPPGGDEKGTRPPRPRR